MNHTTTGKAPVKPTEQNIRNLIALTAVLGVALLAPAVASANFTRKALEPITSVTQPGGVAVGSANEVWVGDLAGAPFAVDEFASALAGNAKLGSFAVATPPVGVAAQRVLPGDGDVYTSGGRNVEVFEPGGGHVETWEGTAKPFNEPEGFNEPLHVAVDDSTDPLDPSACGTLPLALGNVLSTSRLNSVWRSSTRKAKRSRSRRRPPM